MYQSVATILEIAELRSKVYSLPLVVHTVGKPSPLEQLPGDTVLPLLCTSVTLLPFCTVTWTTAAWSGSHTTTMSPSTMSLVVALNLKLAAGPLGVSATLSPRPLAPTS